MTVRELRDALIENHRSGTTIVMNSHMLSEVEMVATRVAILDRGRVLRDGPLADLLTVDRGQYVVECEALENLPAYASVERTANGTIKAALPADRLHDFVWFVQSSGGRLMTCALKRENLEDSFIALVGGNRA